jgi:protein-disulfide isomerase
LDQRPIVDAKKSERIEAKGQMSEGTILDGERDHVQGQTQAPITLLEYGDYGCRFCARVQPVVKEIQQRFGGTSALRFGTFR